MQIFTKLAYISISNITCVLREMKTSPALTEELPARDILSHVILHFSSDDGIVR